MYSTNCLLPKDIKINSLKRVDDDFHARFSAKKKEYKYIVNLKGNNPFNYELNAEMYLDVDDNLLKESLNLFIGEHNFQDFTSKEEDDNNFVRTIYFASFTRSGDQLVISFIGNGFMRYQIRDMVATALMVAANKESIDFIKDHLKDKKERDIVSYKAPAEGLYLEEVYY
jgi:tRNA pseudouridine38-40 synthase